MGNAPIDALLTPTFRDEQTTVWGPRHRRLSNSGAGANIVVGGPIGTPPWPDVGPGQIEWLANLHWIISPFGVEVFAGMTADVVDLAGNSIAIIDSQTALGGAGVIFERAIQPDVAIIGGEHLVRVQVAFIPGASAFNNVTLSWSSLVTIRGNASLY